jgi:hypothetical protein
MCAQHPVTQPVKNRPEDDYLLVETCSLHITLCNKNSCADVQISITVRTSTVPIRDIDVITVAVMGWMTSELR